MTKRVSLLCSTVGNKLLIIFRLLPGPDSKLARNKSVANQRRLFKYFKGVVLWSLVSLRTLLADHSDKFLKMSSASDAMEVAQANDNNQTNDGNEHNELQNFEIQKKIGRGQFSVVYKARSLISNCIVALKKVQVRDILNILTFHYFQICVHKKFKFSGYFPIKRY